MTPGVVQQNPYGYKPLKASNPLVNQYKLYGSAVEQQAGDYGNIMQGYQDIFNKAKQMPLATPQAYTPQQYNYSPSSDYTSAIKNMQDLAQTGGYSGSDIQNLRERGISPIRSIYAGAQRNVDRQRALQGGYSPNYGAVSAKMAREQSDSIANQMTNVNAGIAQNIAQNKLSIAPSLTSATGQESALKNQYGMRNTDIQNESQKFNIEMPFEVGRYNMGLQGQGLEALRGMQGLYGTTPALSSLFGNQALQSAEFQNTMNQQGSNRGLQYISQLMRG